MKMESFWKNKRVLVTGHSGFKGSWLSIWLDALGASVTGLSLTPEKESNIISLSPLNGRITHFYGDINDGLFVHRVLSESDPEIVIHMAAQPLVLRSYMEPMETLETNVLGTARILNELQQLKRSGLSCKAFLNVTTDKVYKNKEWVWGYREIDELGGNDPYSCSKACSELITAMFAKSFFHGDDISLATARAGNVVGGGDWSENRLVPDCIKSLVKGNDIVLRRPESVRPWQHVIEPLAGYLLLSEYLYNNKVGFDSWNFGSDRSHTVRDVSENMHRLWKPEKGQIIMRDSEYEETNLLKLNSSKSESIIGWKNVFSMETTLEYVINWYYNVLVKNKSSYDTTLEQLESISSCFNKNSILIN